MFAVRMPDGCVGLCDGLLHEKPKSNLSFIAYYDRKGIKRIVGFNPEDLTYPVMGSIDMHFDIEELTATLYKQIVATVE